MTSSVNTINAADTSGGGTTQPVTTPNSPTKNSVISGSESTTTASPTTKSVNYGDKFLTSVQLTDIKGDPWNLNNSMKAVWSFVIPVGTTINANDTMVFKVPDQLALSNNDIDDVIDKYTKTNIGTVSLDSTNRTVTITFNKNATDQLNLGSPVNGSFSVTNLKWDQNTVKVNEENKLIWTTNGSALENSTNNVTVAPAPPDPNEILYKFGGLDKNNSQIIHWTARVNYKEEPIENAIYRDIVGNNQTLDFSSLKAYTVTYDKGTGSGTGNYTKDPDSDYSKDIFTQTDDGFTAKLGNISKTVLIDYDTKINNNMESNSYGNTGELLSGKRIITVVPVNLSKTIVSGSVENKDDIISLYGQKNWKDEGDPNVNHDQNVNHDPITVNLFKATDPSKIIKSQQVDADTGWSYLFSNIPVNEPDGTKINYQISENPVPNYTTEIIPNLTSETNKYNITNTYSPDTTKFTVNKVWHDDNNSAKIRPDSIKVQLYADGVVSGNPVTLSDNQNDATKNWTYTWNNLARQKDGKDITYSVKEVTDPKDDKYTADVQSMNSNESVITNTLKSTTDTTQLNVKKVWNDDNDKGSTRPSDITVKLLADGKETDKTVTLNADNNWKDTFNNLAKQKDGKDITYSIEENQVNGYQKPVITRPSATDITVTNNLDTSNPTTDTTQLNVQKVWNDDNDKDGIRPSDITVELFAGGKTTGKTVTLNDSNNWSASFKDLTKGITYTTKEITVKGYSTKTTTSKDGTDVVITNSHTPSGHVVPPTKNKTMTVTKLWNDDNNQDKLRPESIKVQLFANGQMTGDPVTLNADNQWTHSWNNLDQDINYTVKEIDTNDGYTATTLTNGNKITITNTHTPTTPGNPGTPSTPGNPSNPKNPNPTIPEVPSVPSIPSNPFTPETPGTTPVNPSIPSVPSTPSTPTNGNDTPKTPFGYLPQTGSKDANIMYTVIGLIILGIVATIIVRKRTI